MEADFSGYATKAGLKCSDGRTIMPEAFKHMDGKTVPLVWQHGHNDPDNVLGHASRGPGRRCLRLRVLQRHRLGEERQGARRAQGHHRALDLRQPAGRASKQVFHGIIREVSLVLSGANPGALIDNISVVHSRRRTRTRSRTRRSSTPASTLEHAKKTYTMESTTTAKTMVDGDVTGTDELQLVSETVTTASPGRWPTAVLSTPTRPFRTSTTRSPKSRRTSFTT